MAFFKRNADPDQEPHVVTATVRIARDLGALGGVRAGDLVLTQTPGLSTEAAQALVDRHVSGVLNVNDDPQTDSFPRFGARVLSAAGIPLVENLGSDLWDSVRSGETLRLEGGSIYRGDALVGIGQRQTPELIDETIGRASAELANRLDSVTANAAERLRRERALLIDGDGAPRISTGLKGRPAVVVNDAFEVRSDLSAIKRFIRDNDPGLIAVGSGADVLKAAGLTPHVVIGTSSELTQIGIDQAADIVVVSAGGQLEGADRFEKRSQSAQVFTSTGTSEDLALLLADAGGASVIVTAGYAPTLEALLERDIADVSSSFVTRLAVGPRLVDAKAVRQFAVQRIGWIAPLLLLLAGVVAVAVAVSVTPRGGEWFADPAAALGDFWNWIKGLIT